MYKTIKTLITILCLAFATGMMAQEAKVGNTFDGKATYYSNKLHGRHTSDGGIYDKNGLTCAHRTLPFGTMLKVTSKKNGKSVIVKVTDRGPWSKRFVIDLSWAAAQQLEMIRSGVIDVEIEVVEAPKKN